MIERTLSKTLARAARQYPVVTVTGPRQSGKTTLCRHVFPKKPYVTLEPLDVRELARTDPRGLLAGYAKGAIFDEVQHVPELLSYLQEEVDLRPRAGRFILTGSQHFGLTEALGQSLAGRTAVLTLLPPSLAELRQFQKAPRELFPTLFGGAYPRIYDRKVPPQRWLADYVTTYVQRDVRQVLQVGDLTAFTTFLRLCAGRSAQEVNLSALGADAGVSHNTARAWLSVLEASYICFRVPAFHGNVTKQAIKAPKLHFFDSGLLCFLLGIRTSEELVTHPLRGSIFESWVASEIYKARVHGGHEPALFHLRDAKALEVDLVLQAGPRATLIEVKSGATLASDHFTNLERAPARLTKGGLPEVARRVLVYGGTRSQRGRIDVLPWSQLVDERWTD